MGSCTLLGLVGELHVGQQHGNTLTSENVLMACCHFLFWPFLVCTTASGHVQLLSTVCEAVLMQCSHVSSTVNSLNSHCGHHSYFISVSFNFPSLPSSPPILSDPFPSPPHPPLPSPHCPNSPLPSPCSGEKGRAPSPQNMLQTLKYLALLVVPTFIAGNRLLSRLGSESTNIPQLAEYQLSVNGVGQQWRGWGSGGAVTLHSGFLFVCGGLEGPQQQEHC